MIALQVLVSCLSDLVIDTDYYPISPNIQHKPYTSSNEPEEIETDDTADSMGSIQNNIGEHQYQAILAQGNERIKLFIIQGFRTIVFIFILTTFPPICPPSGDFCRTREPTQNFEPRPLFNSRRLLALIPLTITGYKC